MTRSFWFGKNPDEEFVKIESVVKKAYQKTIEKLETQFEVEEMTVLEGKSENNSHNFKKGVAKKNTDLSAKNIDTTARTYITQAGYGKNFNHTTGHGLGLEIHEQPSLSWANETQLKSGMVITVEPGIYILGKFGYRYENTVLIS